MEFIVGKILRDRYRIIQELSPRLYGIPSTEFCFREDLHSGSIGNGSTFVQGNFCYVYLAEDLSQNIPVKCLIERLQPSYSNEVLGWQSWQKVLNTFLSLGDVFQKISHHPQIPQLWDFFECDREFYLVYEYLEGKSLAEKLDSVVINESEALIWLREILGILELSHELGMAHLNIQPSSLILHQDGKRFLSNFTVFKNPMSLNSYETQNKTNDPVYSGDKSAKLNYRTDIYALGKTIIFALTGNFESFIQAQSTDVTKEIKRIENLSSVNIRPELATTLNKMVEKNYAQGYQSVKEVLADLDFEQNVITFPPSFVKRSYSSSPRETKPKLDQNIDKNQLNFKNFEFKFPVKILWLLSALPFAIAALIIFIGINKNTDSKFSSYINNDYKFSLKYPQNWSQRQLDDPITGEVVVFNSPLETTTDLFIEKLYITVEYLPSELASLEQYTQLVFQRINKTKGSNIEERQDYKTSIDNFPAHKVIYSRQEGNLLLRQMETFTIRNNQVYIAIYAAERAKFSKFRETVEKMISSWEIE